MLHIQLVQCIMDTFGEPRFGLFILRWPLRMDCFIHKLFIWDLAFISQLTFFIVAVKCSYTYCQSDVMPPTKHTHIPTGVPSASVSAWSPESVGKKPQNRVSGGSGKIPSVHSEVRTMWHLIQSYNNLIALHYFITTIIPPSTQLQQN